jgi:hypothetical protein
MKLLSKRRLLLTATVLLTAAAAAMGSQALAGAKDTTGAAKGLGQLSGLLPRDHLTTESAIQVDLPSRLPFGLEGGCRLRVRAEPPRALSDADKFRHISDALA